MATETLDRLLDAANELFHEEGVHTVGIDRIINPQSPAAARVVAATLESAAID